MQKVEYPCKDRERDCKMLVWFLTHDVFFRCKSWVSHQQKWWKKWLLEWILAQRECQIWVNWTSSVILCRSYYQSERLADLIWPYCKPNTLNENHDFKKAMEELTFGYYRWVNARFNEYSVFVRLCAKVKESIRPCRVYILGGHSLDSFIHRGRENADSGRSRKQGRIGSTMGGRSSPSFQCLVDSHDKF